MSSRQKYTEVQPETIKNIVRVLLGRKLCRNMSLRCLLRLIVLHGVGGFRGAVVHDREFWAGVTGIANHYKIRGCCQSDIVNMI